MPMAAYFDIEKTGKVAIVTPLIGEMSFEEAEELKQQLYVHVSERTNLFVVDMHRCGFVSSVALGVLVCFTARVHSFDGRVVLCDLPKEVATLLEITKLGKIYDIYATRDQAVAALAGT